MNGKLKLVAAVGLALVAGGLMGQEAAEEEDLLPPRVVAVDPPLNATGVSADRATISVTFDRPMEAGRNWSWIIMRQHGAYPGIRGGPDPTWDEEGRTCSLDVLLKPGRLYAIGVNSPRHTGFHDTLGWPALSYGWAFSTAEMEPEEMLPHVVSTSPEAGALDVDPDLRSITVTFDRPMTPDSWSWVRQQGRGEYPGFKNGAPTFDAEGLTCTLPVWLQPGTVYAVSANSHSHTNFRSEEGDPALPFAWAFRTRDVDAPPG